MSEVRIGVVGGRFGASFQFHEHPDCIVEAVSDLRARRGQPAARLLPPLRQLTITNSSSRKNSFALSFSCLARSVPVCSTLDRYMSGVRNHIRNVLEDLLQPSMPERSRRLENVLAPPYRRVSLPRTTGRIAPVAAGRFPVRPLMER